MKKSRIILLCCIFTTFLFACEKEKNEPKKNPDPVAKHYIEYDGKKYEVTNIMISKKLDPLSAKYRIFTIHITSPSVTYGQYSRDLTGTGNGIRAIIWGKSNDVVIPTGTYTDSGDSEIKYYDMSHCELMFDYDFYFSSSLNTISISKATLTIKKKGDKEEFIFSGKDSNGKSINCTIVETPFYF